MPRKASSTTSTKTRATRTKDELNADLTEVQTKVNSADVADPKALEAARARTAEIRESVKNISVDTALQGVGKVNLEVSKLFSAISEAVIQQAKHLETVSEAVNLAEQDLQELHGKDVVASSLTSLLAEFEAKKLELQQKKAEQEEAWKREAAAHDKLWKEQQLELQKQRTREQQEYDYNLAKARKSIQDDFDEKMAALEKQNRERQEALTKSWNAREQALAAQETELANFKKQVEEFPTKLASEVKREVAIATNSQKREHDFAMQIATKDASAQVALSSQKIAALEASRAEQAAIIADLQKQLAAAKEQVANIATKALESASGAVALERVTSFTRNNESMSKAGKA
jgi:hypothetical protein